VFGSAYQRRYDLAGNQTYVFPPPTKIGLKTLRKRGRRAGMAEAYEKNIEIMDNIDIMQELDMNV
jgi:hypothetical protein